MVLPSFLLGINWHPALFFSAFISIFLLFECSYKGDFQCSSWVIFSVFLAFLVIASDFYGKVVLGVKGGNSALYNVIFLIITFLPYIAILSKMQVEVSFKVFIRTVNIFFILFLIISLLQALGPQSVSELLIKLYSHEPHTSVALSGSRYTLTGPDPNVGSTIAAFFIVFYFVFSVQRRKLKYFLLLFASLIPLFLAQGRTVMIGLAICFMLYFWFFSGLRLRYKFFIFIVVILIVLIGVSFVQVDYLIRGISELSKGESGSVNVRLQKALIVLDTFMDSPIIGQGANLEKYGRVTHIDSEYLLLLQRHGLIGFTFVVGVILILMSKAIFFIRSSLSSHMLFILCGVALFVMLTNVFIFNIDTFGIFVLMLYLFVTSKNSFLRYTNVTQH
jgi:hypothetical protein